MSLPLKRMLPLNGHPDLRVDEGGRKNWRNILRVQIFMVIINVPEAFVHRYLCIVLYKLLYVFVQIYIFVYV